MYRNDTAIAKRIKSAHFSEGSYTVPDTKIEVVKKLIKVHLTIGRTFDDNSLTKEVDKKAYQKLDKTIEYVLKYW